MQRFEMAQEEIEITLRVCLDDIDRAILEIFHKSPTKSYKLLQKVQEEQQKILKTTQELSIDQMKRTDESISQVIDLVQKVSLQFYSSLSELKEAIVSMGRS